MFLIYFIVCSTATVVAVRRVKMWIPVEAPLWKRVTLTFLVAFGSAVLAAFAIEYIERIFATILIFVTLLEEAQITSLGNLNPLRVIISASGKVVGSVFLAVTFIVDPHWFMTTE